MAYASDDTDYGVTTSVFSPDSGNSDRISIPDAELLFRGHFGRHGPDLVLTGQDGERHLVPGYFSTEQHPTLVAPNGAHLSGDLVDLLAGSPTPGQYAQGRATMPADAIGKVEKVVGNVTVMRNGTSVVLHVGDAVFKSDVIQTSDHSSVGIAFPDGTALDLVANTRMALSEYTFEQNGAANGAVFSLVEGTFAFVAGQVAHTGNGMQIATPVATMGIRGTVGLFRSETTVVNSQLGHVWSVILHEDIDGTHHLGRIAFIDQDPTSPTFGQVFYLLDSSDYIAYLEPQGPGLPPHVRLEPLTNSKIFDDQHFFDDLGQIINLFNGNNVNPQSTPQIPGSSTPPNLLLIQQQLIQENGGPPIFNNYPFENPVNPYLPPNTPGTIPVLPNTIPNTIPNTPPSTIFIWNSNSPASWSQQLGDWNQGAAPGSPIDTVIIQSGTSNYDINGLTSIGFLEVDQGATLDVTSGELAAGGLLDNGIIDVDGDPPALVINGPSTIGSTGKVIVGGSGSEVDFNGTVFNEGRIVAKQGGVVDFNGDVNNQPGGKIIARGKDSEINFVGTLADPLSVDNFGLIAARHHGTVAFDDANVTNETGGEIRANGHDTTVAFGDSNFFNLGSAVSKNGGEIAFDDASVDNEHGGTIEAKRDSKVSFTNTNVTNERTALLAAIGCGALITFSEGAQAANAGKILAEDGGIVVFDDTQVTNQDHGRIEADRGTIDFVGATVTNAPTGDAGGHGTIEATDWGAIYFQGGSVENGNTGNGVGALIEAIDHGSITFEGTKGNSLGVTNDAGGKFEASGCGSVIAFDGKHVSVTNDGGVFVAEDRGEIVFDHVSGVTNEDRGEIKARDHGTVLFEDTKVTNAGGLIEAIGCGSTIELADSTINGGTLSTFDGGLIEIVAGYNTFLNVTLDHAVVQIDCGAVLNLSGGDATPAIAATIDGDVTFEGRGIVTIDYQSYDIVGGTPKATLYNDTKIVGAGEIGGGLADGDSLTLVNDGVIAALYLGKDHGDFVIDTGIGLHGAATTYNDGYIVGFGDKAVMEIEDTTLQNDCRGTIAAVDCGTVIISDSIVKGGTIVAIFDGTVDIDGSTVRGADISALHRGTVDVDNSTIKDSSISALHHSTVTLDDATIVDSTLDTGHGSEIETVTNHGHATTSTFDNVTNEGFVLVQADTTLALEGTIRNYGTILVDSAERGATLQIDGKVILKGCGDVVLDGRDDKITNGADGGTLVNDSTISGYGEIVSTTHGESESDGLTLHNGQGGVIDADVCGHALVIDTGNTVINDGLLEATWGGILDIRDDVNNSHGEIEAHRNSTVIIDGATIDDGHGKGGMIEASGCGATVELQDATIDGGTLRTSDGGVIETVTNDGHATTSTFDNVTNEGFVLVQSDTTLALEGTIWNYGTILVDSAERGATLEIDGTVTLKGCGDVVLDGRDDKITNGADGGTLINDSTISGYGEIVSTSHGESDSDGLTLHNGPGGVIDADVCGHALVIDTGNTVINDGLLEASRGGILDIRDDVNNANGEIEAHRHSTVIIDGATIDNASRHNDGGVIEACGCGATVQLQDATIKGGDLITSDPYGADGGVIEIDATGKFGMSVFDGSCAPVKIEGFVQVDAGAALELQGTIDNKGGTIELDQDGVGRHAVGSSLVIDGNVTLNGDGVVALEGSDTGIVGSCAGGTLTNNSYIYNARGGFIGDGDDSLTFINNGEVISWDSAAPALVINTGGNEVINTGLLEATYGSTLDIYGSVDNAGGLIEIESGGYDIGSTLNLYGATIHNGKLTIDSQSTVNIEAANAWNPDTTLDHVTVTDQGTINVDEPTQPTTLTLDGGTTISGGGTLSVGKDGNLDIEGGGAVLDDITVDVSKHATIEVGETATGAILTLEDDTTISGGTLTIANGAELDIEHGSNGEGATLDDVKVVNDGTINVDEPTRSTTLTLEGGTSVDGGKLTIGAKGELLVTEGENGKGATLDDVTVNNGNTIVVDAASGTILTLDYDTSIIGGSLTIDGSSELHIGKGGATLDGVNVTDDNSITIDATLTLEDGTTVASGDGFGTLTIDAHGKLDIEAGSSNGNGATLDGVTVTDNGAIDIGDVASGAVLTLDDGSIIAGGGTGTLTISEGSELHIEASTGATLDGVLVTDDGQIVIDSKPATLTLTDGTTIDGHGIGTLLIEHNGTLDVEAGTVSGNATLDDLVVTNDNLIEVGATTSGAVLTLDDGTSVTNGTIDVRDGSTVNLEGATITNATLEGAGTFETPAGTNTLPGDTIDAGSTLQTNDGTFLDLQGTTTLTGSVTFEGGGTFTLDGTIKGGTIDADNANFAVAPDTTAHVESAVSVVLPGDTASFTIGDAATLDFGNSVGEGSSVSFAGTGTLQIDDAKDFDATVGNFSADDLIDLTGISYSANDKLVWDQSTGTLEIENKQGKVLDTLDLTGTYTQSEFALQADSSSAHAGTEVTWTGPGIETINGVKTEVGFGSSATISINGENQWVVTEGGQNFTLASGVDSVVLGSTTYMLVDQHNEAFQSIQTAIDASQNGDTILVAPGTYTESANYNPSNNTDSSNDPLGLLINKSVTIDGVNSTGQLVTNAADTAATVVSSVESNWGTNFYVTAPNVTITGLNFEGTDNAYEFGYVNKVIEVVANNFTLQDSYVGAIDGLPVGSSVYVDELTVPTNLSGYVADISSFDISHNILTGDFVEANGVGYGDATTNLLLTDNEFTLNKDTTLATYINEFGGANYVVVLNGEIAGVAWDNAPVTAPTVSGNTVEPGYTSSPTGGVFVAVDSDPANLPGATYIADYVADNHLSHYAYALTAAGTPDYSTAGSPAYDYYTVYLNAGAASAAANTGDTLVVESGHDSSAQTIVTDGLTIDAQEGSRALNLDLGTGVQNITLVDEDTHAGSTLTVTGNALTDNVVDKSGVESLTVNGGSGSLNLEVDASVSHQNIDFNVANGTLKIDDPSGFHGTVSGVSDGDTIDLGGFSATATDSFSTVANFNSGNDTTTLTVTDTSNNTVESLTLAGNESSVTWTPTYDGSGGVDVVDPPTATSAATATGASGTINFADGDSNAQTTTVTPEGTGYTGTFSAQLAESNGIGSIAWQFDLGNDQINLAPGQTETQSYNVAVADGHNMLANQTVSISIGGPGNDAFVFTPGVGADTIVNFNPQADTIELDHFAAAQTVQQLAALVTTDTHGDAVIELGHQDSITIAGVSAAQMQQAIQSGHVLLH